MSLRTLGSWSHRRSSLPSARTWKSPTPRPARDRGQRRRGILVHRRCASTRVDAVGVDAPTRLEFRPLRGERPRQRRGGREAADEELPAGAQQQAPGAEVAVERAAAVHVLQRHGGLREPPRREARLDPTPLPAGAVDVRGHVARIRVLGNDAEHAALLEGLWGAVSRLRSVIGLGNMWYS